MSAGSCPIVNTVKLKSSFYNILDVFHVCSMLNALCSCDNRDGFMPMENCLIENIVNLKST